MPCARTEHQIAQRMPEARARGKSIAFSSRGPRPMKETDVNARPKRGVFLQWLKRFKSFRETEVRGTVRALKGCLLAGQYEALRIGGDPDPAPPAAHARLQAAARLAIAPSSCARSALANSGLPRHAHCSGFRRTAITDRSRDQTSAAVFHQRGRWAVCRASRACGIGGRIRPGSP
jgi:hypothetical protein